LSYVPLDYGQKKGFFIEVGREALRIQETVAPEKVFDFSLYFFTAARRKL
jgi:hypothetical protein